MTSTQQTPPPIPVGLASKLGVIATALASGAAAVFAFQAGDHSAETITAILVAGATVVVTIWGRMAQAAAGARLGTVVTVTNPVSEPLLPVEGRLVSGSLTDRLADPALDDPDGDEEPDLTEEDLAGRYAEDPARHAAEEAQAFGDIGLPKDSTIEENNRA